MGSALNLSERMIHLLKIKWDSLAASILHMNSVKSLTVRPEAIEHLHEKLLALSSDTVTAQLQQDEEALVRLIREETNRHNRNNVTRTKAYLDMYIRHPELHWAFLAHMVSRNGGCYMTDLKGELLPRLLSGDQRESLFQFLERANALIFGDAYPQLLLYEESKKQGRPLFHLLQPLRISAFMGPIWTYFFQSRDAVMITIALIINEQNFIEPRVVQQSYYKDQVFDTLFFKTQSILQLNQVLFPYISKPQEIGSSSIRLAGLTMEQFTSLDERISFGKRLYAILFGVPAVKDGALRYATQHPHTGSRADYWPHLFAPVRRKPPLPPSQWKPHLDGVQLAVDAEPIYSPPLSAAWPDRPVAPSEPGDWFREADIVRYLASVKAPLLFDMTAECAFGLSKLEAAIIAASWL